MPPPETPADTPGPDANAPETRRPTGRLGLAGLMTLIAGFAFSLWLFLPDLKKEAGQYEVAGFLLLVASAALGGVSAVGVPSLLLEKWRTRRTRGARWGAGRLLWFSTGTAAWLLWPPIVVRRAAGKSLGETTSGVCYVYGTPLMALYVCGALVAGGWLGRRTRNRRRARRDWHERFGLALGLAWACTGLYVLSIIYRDDLFK